MKADYILDFIGCINKSPIELKLIKSEVSLIAKIGYVSHHLSGRGCVIKMELQRVTEVV